MLLQPVLVELSPLQARQLEPRLDELRALGLDCQPFGGSVFLVRATPHLPGMAHDAAAIAAALVEDAATDSDDGWMWSVSRWHAVPPSGADNRSRQKSSGRCWPIYVAFRSWRRVRMAARCCYATPIRDWRAPSSGKLRAPDWMRVAVSIFGGDSSCILFYRIS